MSRPSNAFYQELDDNLAIPHAPPIHHLHPRGLLKIIPIAAQKITIEQTIETEATGTKPSTEIIDLLLPTAVMNTTLDLLTLPVAKIPTLTQTRLSPNHLLNIKAKITNPVQTPSIQKGHKRYYYARDK
jgi:hypothetical protein